MNGKQPNPICPCPCGCGQQTKKAVPPGYVVDFFEAREIGSRGGSITWTCNAIEIRIIFSSVNDGIRSMKCIGCGNFVPGQILTYIMRVALGCRQERDRENNGDWWRRRDEQWNDSTRQHAAMQ